MPTTLRHSSGYSNSISHVFGGDWAKDGGICEQPTTSLVLPLVTLYTAKPLEDNFHR